jgi:WD40 repeat protein
LKHILRSIRTSLLRIVATRRRKIVLGVIVISALAIVSVINPIRDPDSRSSFGEHISSLEKLPADEEFIADYTGEELDIVGLRNRNRFVWDLPSAATQGLAPQNAGQRLAWIASLKTLFFATSGSATLISADGADVRLDLEMPGKLKPLDGMQTYGVSSNGRQVAYVLYTRDAGDMQPDGLGRLYMDVMFQNIEGGAPKSVLPRTIASAISWSPDDTRLAVGAGDGKLTIVDLTGKILKTIQIRSGDTLGREPMDHIDDVRWQPHGQLVALIDNWQLYIVNANGADLHKMSFAAPIIRIGAFTWSPDGARFAFRAVTNTACHFAMREDSFKECTTKSSIFTSSVDGSMLKKIRGTETAITTSQYRGSSLIWIK